MLLWVDHTGTGPLVNFEIYLVSEEACWPPRPCKAALNLAAGNIYHTELVSAVQLTLTPHSGAA